MNRVCPICDMKTEESNCPHDGYATIDLKRYTSALSTDSMIGRVLQEKYRLLMKLGSGGMGAVYKGLNLNLRQDVAVKVMKRELSEDLNSVKRFHREALATSKLRHPNSVRIFDFGQEEDGLLFIVMELLVGKPLSDVLEKEKRLPPLRVMKIMKQALAALSEAHNSGIVHRDLKPSNIFLLDMIGMKDFVKILDFGIAKVVAGDTGESALTKTGLVMGTPHYMSPEQVEAKGADGRTDLYSLGVIAYECLAGIPPFTGETPLAVMMKQMNDPPPPFDPEIFATLPAGFERLIFSMLEKEPDRRPADAERALEIIEAMESGAHERGGTALGDAAITLSKKIERDSLLGKVPIKEETEDMTTPISVEMERGVKGFRFETTNDYRKLLPKKRRWQYAAPLIILLAAAGFYFLIQPAPYQGTEDLVLSTSDAVQKAVQQPSLPPKIIEKEIVISSNPAGADVKVNGEIVGKTPFSLKMREDEKPARIILEKQGFLTEERMVDPSKDKDVSIVLIKKSESVKAPSEVAPVYQKKISPPAAKVEPKSKKTKKEIIAAPEKKEVELW